MSDKTFNALFTTGIIVRLAGIWIPQLWYDENFTLLLARLPFDRMMIATMGDVHPPLWYLIEWMFLRIFPDPLLSPAWTLRIPALIFSVLALWAFRVVLDELYIPARIQTGAMLLMVLLPFQLWYAQEARMYSLLELEVLLVLLFTIRAQWLELLITSAAMLYTQNYGMIYLACIGLIVFVKDVRYLKVCHSRMGSVRLVNLLHVFKPTLRTAAAMLAAFALYLPWVKVLSSQMAYIGGRYWIQSPAAGDLLYIVYKLFWGSSMPGFGLLSALIVTFMMISVGIMHITHAHHCAQRTVLIMAFSPLTLAWIASVLWNPILLHRPLIGSAPFLYIIVAWPIEMLLQDRQEHLHLPANVTHRSQETPVLSQFKWREAVLAAALIVPILFSGMAGYYKNIPAMKNEGADSSLLDALVYIQAHWQPGDVIYYTDDGPAINLMPYAGDLPQYGMAACGEKSYGLVLGSLNPRTRNAIGLEVRDLDEIEYQRAWVLAPMSPLHPKCYEEQIKPLTPGDPIITVDNNVYIFSGIWLLEK